MTEELKLQLPFAILNNPLKGIKRKKKKHKHLQQEKYKEQEQQLED